MIFWLKQALTNSSGLSAFGKATVWNIPSRLFAGDNIYSIASTAGYAKEINLACNIKLI
jgi:hypothetical protein